MTGTGGDWSPRVSLRWLRAAATVTRNVRDRLTKCWWEVSNAGGAVGFPFLPVERREVAAATDELVASLDPSLRTLLLATDGDELQGWLVLTRNQWKLIAHWARVTRVQTSLAARGRGVGSALMEEVARAARDDYALEQLRLEVRGGDRLEGFYERFGWREVGRWPGALRLGPGEDRDEVYMTLDLRAGFPQ